MVSHNLKTLYLLIQNTTLSVTVPMRCCEDCLRINNKVSKGKQEGRHDKSFVQLMYICKMTSIALKKIYIHFGFNQKSLIVNS